MYGWTMCGDDEDDDDDDEALDRLLSFDWTTSTIDHIFGRGAGGAGREVAV